MVTVLRPEQASTFGVLPKASLLEKGAHRACTVFLRRDHRAKRSLVNRANARCTIWHNLEVDKGCVGLTLSVPLVARWSHAAGGRKTGVRSLPFG